MPKYLGYFERLLEGSGGTYLTGRRLTYVDLSLFQTRRRAALRLSEADESL